MKEYIQDLQISTKDKTMLRLRIVLHNRIVSVLQTLDLPFVPSQQSRHKLSVTLCVEGRDTKSFKPDYVERTDILDPYCPCSKKKGRKRIASTSNFHQASITASSMLM